MLLHTTSSAPPLDRLIVSLKRLRKRATRRPRRAASTLTPSHHVARTSKARLNVERPASNRLPFGSLQLSIVESRPEPTYSAPQRGGWRVDRASLKACRAQARGRSSQERGRAALQPPRTRAACGEPCRAPQPLGAVLAQLPSVLGCSSRKPLVLSAVTRHISAHAPSDARTHARTTEE